MSNDYGYGLQFYVHHFSVISLGGNCISSRWFKYFPLSLLCLLESFWSLIRSNNFEIIKLEKLWKMYDESKNAKNVVFLSLHNLRTIHSKATLNKKKSFVTQFRPMYGNFFKNIILSIQF